MIEDAIHSNLIPEIHRLFLGFSAYIVIINPVGRFVWEKTLASVVMAVSLGNQRGVMTSGYRKAELRKFPCVGFKESNCTRLSLTSLFSNTAYLDDTCH